MKYIKTYSIFESVSGDQFLKTKEEIESWILKNFGLFTDEHINDDLTIDMDIVNLGHSKLVRFPVRFGKVEGFFCNDNNLVSLEGSPVEVNSFRCENNNLTSLDGCPNLIRGDMHCENNKIESFGDKQILIKGDLFIQNNNIKSIKNFPIVDGDINTYNNPIHEILQFISKSDVSKFIEYLNEYDVMKNDNEIIMDRFKEALYMIDNNDFPIEGFVYSLKNYKAI